MNNELDFFITQLKALTEDTTITGLSSSEICDRFPGTSLSANQLLLISNYLISLGIDVTDYEDLKSAADREKANAIPAKADSSPEKDESWKEPYLEMLEVSKPFAPEEEKRLLILASGGDDSASEMLVASHMRMILDNVEALSVSDESLRADLVPEAIVYLMQEIQSYDPENDLPFAETASLHIREKLNAYLRENDIYNKVSAELMDKLNRARDAYQKLGQLLEREPSEDEIAEELGISAQRLQELMDALPQGTSVFSEFPEGPGDGFSDDEDAPEELLLTEQILKAVSSLPAMEQECFIAYYGLDGSLPKKTADIALQYGMTEDMVRQCVSHALEQMRAAGIDTDFFEV